MATHSERGLLIMTSQRALEVWYPAHRPSHLSAHKIALHDYAVSQIGAETDLRYLEFGVNTGNSILRFASKFTNPEAEFYGFDSFIGLPEHWAGMPAGHFSTDGNMPETSDRRIKFISGWFQNSVATFAPGLPMMPAKPVLVHFDADLYSSTFFILASLWWYIPSYYFIFDEFEGEELAALRNFMSAFPVEIEFLTRTDNEHGSPVQIFGKLKRTRLVVDGIG